jgi:dTDP-4-amino-4,6-dideoxygalactose transaminase
MIQEDGIKEDKRKLNGTRTEKMIWLSSPHMSGHEMNYVRDAMERNQVFPLGQNVADFEETIKQFTGSKSCSCLSSGTAALHLALILLDVQPGDEVICSTFTFAASANPIVYLKARPVFVDSEASTWNMDPRLLRDAIFDRLKKTGKKPKAILLVHLYGMPADMDGIMAVAEEFDIPVLEDAAEALGSRYAGRHCGTIGALGVYSFNGNKIITTSGGGALISNNPDHCRKATFLATQARDEAPHYQHSEIGYNYRMSNICAGIGLGQMMVIDDRISRRREHNAYYRKELEKIEGVSILTEPSERFFSNYWLTTIVLDPQKLGGLNREDLRLGLLEKGIETRPLWKPMHMQPVFADCPAYSSGVSESLFRDGICLPSGSGMDNETRAYVTASIIDILSSSIS